MKKIIFLLCVGIFSIFVGSSSVFAVANANIQCGVGKWKSILELDVAAYYRQARVVNGGVDSLVSAHDKGCDVRVKYTYEYTDDNGFVRKGNRMYTCSITAAQTSQEGNRGTSFDCYSPLWFGVAEKGASRMWAEVVSFGQTDEFPNEANVSVTLYEAHKDVQGVTEMFPSLAKGSVKVFVRK